LADNVKSVELFEEKNMIGIVVIVVFASKITIIIAHGFLNVLAKKICTFLIFL
jgi:hypothetical protein